jgi:hypothetical protein
MNDQLDLDRLRDGLLSLSDPDAGPSDPAPAVNQQVRRMRRRRAAASTGGIAVLTAGVVLASQALAGTSQTEPPVGQLPGNVMSPTAVPLNPTPADGHGTATPRISPKTLENPGNLPTFPLAAPWSDQLFTKLPEANAFRPHGYYVKPETKLDGRPWGMVSYQATESNENGGCLEVAPQGVFDAANCFDVHQPGARAEWRTLTASRGTKPDLQKLGYTLVYGVAHFDARTVKVTLAGGATYQTAAVGTPTSRSQRFFVMVVPVKDAQIAKVEPLDAKGNLAPKLLD